MAHLYKSNPAISMLVVKVESEYFKKAIGRTKFLCEDGQLFQKAVEETIATGEAVTVNAKSVGTDREGATVAVFTITWSLKAKSRKSEI